MCPILGGRVTHPGTDFPNLVEGATCPLCFQPLSNEARTRFERFHDFMTRQAEIAAKKADAALRAGLEIFQKLQFNGFDDTFLAQVEEVSAAAGAAARAIPLALNARRDAIMSAVETGNWTAIPAFDPATLNQLDGLPATIELQADEASRLTDPAAKLALETEQAELAGKSVIRNQKDRIAKVLAALRDAAILSECSNGINTNAITAKTTEISKDILTKGVEAAFKEEMEALGAAERLNVTVGHCGGDRGRSLYGLSLSGAASGRWQRSDVLSEGEQRVVALAYFLAEVRLASSPVGIIIDDPVSSLDHRWCSAVARRLVELARDRQVIVFTHNIGFYVELEGAATEQAVPFHAQFIVRRGHAPGHCDPVSSPWERLKVRDRLKAMELELKCVRASYDQDPDARSYRDMAGAFVDKLRAAWEKAVEEIVLNGVVERFGHVVKTQSLAGVVCDEATFKCVYDAITRLSALTEAHDKATQHADNGMDPKTLTNEVQLLRDFRNAQITKRENAEKQRRKLRRPPEASVILPPSITPPSNI